MKTLVIIRHAKAETYTSEATDFDRKLKERGKSDAAVMASLLHRQNIQPEIFISSPAKRALKTAKIFAQEFDIDEKEILRKPFLYDYYSKEDIQAMLSMDAGNANVAFLFGHNPTLSMLVTEFTGLLQVELPTAGLAALTFPTNTWDDIASQTAQLELFLHPKM